jgi:SHS2 domain-containing protein
MGRFELFEHTADIGVRAYGKDLNEAFAFAAKGMFEVVTDIDSIRPVGEVEIQLEAPDLEDLLANWLSELLYLLDTKKTLMAEFDIEITESPFKLSAKARGETYEPDRHEYKTEIKAITHHMLEVTRLEEGSDKGAKEENLEDKYMVQVLLDI